MTEEEKAELAKQIADWVASPEGKKKLEETAARIRQMNLDAEQARRDAIKHWHEIKNKPMTI